MAEIIAIHKNCSQRDLKMIFFVIQVECPGQEEIENIHLILNNSRTHQSGEKMNLVVVVSCKNYDAL